MWLVLRLIYRTATSENRKNLFKLAEAAPTQPEMSGNVAEDIKPDQDDESVCLILRRIVLLLHTYKCLYSRTGDRCTIPFCKFMKRFLEFAALNEKLGLKSSKVGDSESSFCEMTFCKMSDDVLHHFDCDQVDCNVCSQFKKK